MIDFATGTTRRGSWVLLTMLAVACESSGTMRVDGESTRGDALTSEHGSVDASTTVGVESTGLESADDLDSTGESAASDGGSVFLVELDAGSQTFACDIWAQDCPPGEKCMPSSTNPGSSWDGLRCTPIDPKSVPAGEACMVEGSAFSGIDDCEHGSMCWDVDGQTLVGTCIAMCSGSEAAPICPDPRTHCSVSADGTLALCHPSCHPLLQDCDDSEGCYPIDDEAFACFDTGGEQGRFGEECAFLNVCDPGLFCAAPGEVPNCDSTACCSSFCDVSDPSATGACPGADGGQECVAWYDEGEAPFGHDDVGACVIPT